MSSERFHKYQCIFIISVLMQLANQQKANLGRYGEYGGCLSLLTDRQILIQIGCEPHLKLWLKCSPVLNKQTY